MTNQKTPGSGRSGSRRSRDGGSTLQRRLGIVQRPAIDGIGHNSFKRLARRAGEGAERANGRVVAAAAWQHLAPPGAPCGRPPHCLRTCPPPAGVLRISSDCFDARAGMPRALLDFLRRALPKLAALAEHARRSTVTPNDVAYALKQMGM